MPAPARPARAAARRPVDPGRRRRPRHWWERPIGPAAVIAIVVVALLAAELGARALSPQLPAEFGGEAEIQVKRDQVVDRGSVDVVFAGASTVDAGLDPGVFDGASTSFASSYNAGLKGMPVSVLPRWLAFVERELSPDVVVVDVQPTQLVVGKGELAAASQLQATSFGAWVDDAIGGFGPDLERAVGERSDLVEDREDLRRPSLVARALADRAAGRDRPEPITSDTSEFVLANTTAAGRNLQFRQVPDQVSLDPGGAQAFDRALGQGLELGDTRRALQEIQDLGVPVVLTVLPIDVATLSELGMSRPAYDAAVAALRDLAGELDLPLVEYPDLDDPGLFHDKVHLADPGAAAASTQLATAVDELCAARLRCS